MKSTSSDNSLFTWNDVSMSHIIEGVNRRAERNKIKLSEQEIMAIALLEKESGLLYPDESKIAAMFSDGLLTPGMLTFYLP